MATSFTASLHVAGLNELLTRLRDAKGNQEAKNALRTGLRAGAKRILSAVKAYAPVDTGALEESLKVRAIKRSRKNKDSVGVTIGTRASDNLFVGETFYAGMQEWGTVKMPPNPFMRPGFDASKDDAISDMRIKIGSEVERRLRGGK